MKKLILAFVAAGALTSAASASTIAPATADATQSSTTQWCEPYRGH